MALERHGQDPPRRETAGPGPFSPDELQRVNKIRRDFGSQRLDFLFQFFSIRKNTDKRGVVTLCAREREQLLGIGDAAADAPERLDHRLESLLLPADFLRAPRRVGKVP